MLFILLSFYACKKIDFGFKTETEKLVSNTKEWWYAEFVKSAEYKEIDKTSVFALSEKKFSEKKSPSWKRAITYKTGKYDVVEMPLVYAANRYLLPGIGTIINTPEAKRIMKAFVTKLLVFSKPNGERELRIATLVPSRNYAKKVNYDLSNISFKQLPTDFEGYQLIRKWNETQVNMIQINGRLKGRQLIKKADKGTFQILKNGKRELFMPSSAKDKKMNISAKVKGTANNNGFDLKLDWVVQCDVEWVPKVISVCVVPWDNYGTDEPTEADFEDCPEYESNTDGEYVMSCDWVWQDTPLDPCTEWVIDCENGSDPPQLSDPDPDPDPCDSVKTQINNADNLAKNSKYTSAKTDIQTIASDGKEHAVSFGKDANGNIIRSNASTGNSAPVPNISGQFADLHNHPNNLPPSSGDLYGLIDMLINKGNYETRYIMTSGGTVYALAVIDKQEALNFNNNYPRVPNVGYEPDFPIDIVDEFNEATQTGGATKEMAKAFILKKYNTGIALFKQNANGDFKLLNTLEHINKENGVKSYTTNNCN